MAKIQERWSDGRIVVSNLRRRLTLYERRYEMRSADMQCLLSLSATKETADIAKWMQTYQVLKMVTAK